MADQQDRLQEDLDTLQRVRDELRVQLHLAKVEARDRFEVVEKKWHELESKVSQMRGASRESMSNVSTAASLLVDQIKAGYDQVRRML